VVGADDVRRRVEVGEEPGLVIDALPLRLEARLMQLMQHQLGVGLAVLEDQHPQGTGHPLTPAGRSAAQAKTVLACAAGHGSFTPPIASSAGSTAGRYRD